MIMRVEEYRKVGNTGERRSDIGNGNRRHDAFHVPLRLFQ